MAKRKINKSAEIRAYLVDHPDAGPKEVGEYLKKKRIKVQPALVSNVKAALRRNGIGGYAAGRRRGRPSRKSLVSVEHLVAARDFADRVGGLQPAMTALDALSKLR